MTQSAWEAAGFCCSDEWYINGIVCQPAAFVGGDRETTLPNAKMPGASTGHFVEFSKRSALRHQHCVDHVNDAVGAFNIGCDNGSAVDGYTRRGINVKRFTV